MTKSADQCSSILNDRMNAGDPVKKDEEIRQISSATCSASLQ